MTFRFFIVAVIITGCFLFNRNGFCNAGEPAIISLWPGTAPGETAELPPEGEFTEGGHGYGMRHVDGMPVTDWTNQATQWLSKIIPKK